MQGSMALTVVAQVARCTAGWLVGLALLSPASLASAQAPEADAAAEDARADRAPAAGGAPKLAFLGLTPAAGLDTDLVDAISSYTQSQVAALDVYQVIGASEIQALLGLEAQRQLLGCSEDSSCLAEIGGALGAERALTGDVARIGSSLVVNLSLLDPSSATVVARVGRRVPGAQTAEPVLDVLPALVWSLAHADPAVRDALPPAPPAAGASEAAPSLDLALGLRGDVELTGGLASGVVGRLRAGPLLGVAVTALLQPLARAPLGARLALRLYPLQTGRLAVYASAGGAFFPGIPAREDRPGLGGPLFGLRAGLGAELALGRHLLLFADLHYERLLADAQGLSGAALRPDAFLLGAGIAYRP